MESIFSVSDGVWTVLMVEMRYVINGGRGELGKDGGILDCYCLVLTEREKKNEFLVM